MTPIVTIWPTEATGEFSSYVCEKMHEEGFDDRTHRSVGFSETKSTDLPQTLQNAFRSLIPLGAPTTTLKVVAVVPVFEEHCVEAVARLADVIAGLTESYALHVFCLQGGIARVLDFPKDKQNATNDRDNIRAITSRLASQRYRAFTIVIDDYLATGAPINFTKPLLARFLATLMRAMGENYDALFPATVAMDEGKVLSMGLSQARFDRRITADYLLHRAFVAALESVDIMQEHVDIPVASLRAERHLDGLSGFYDEVYKEHVAPKLDQNMSEDQIAAQISPLIKADVQKLKDRVTAFLEDDSLSLPEKEATFAMLIGHDNQRLAGYLYDGKKKDFDDALEVPLDIYIKSYNDLAVSTGLLPARGACEYLRLPDIGEGQDTMPNPRNLEACNPLPELKKLKAEMLDQTSHVRRKEEELGKLRAIVEGERRMGKILKNGSIHRAYNDVVEQPLNDVYEPKSGLEIKNEVDLRGMCSPIRDQGELGSCTSFAVTAMYEVIVNALNPGTVGKANLSERYLFYHSNVLNGRIDRGSNFYTQFEVIGKHGICAETLYPYTTIELSKEPSPDANKDAEQHRVLCAKQIRLKNNGKKYDNIKENHRLLTSALSEGYAVGFSLRIFDDFGSEEGGFISLPVKPSDEASGYHAMVIVGYSEIEKCYIVRNSWGEQFGDNGYCYISSVYVDDPEYISFACIIAETTEGTAQTVDVPAPKVAGFGATQTVSQMAAVRNTIDEVNIYLDYLKERYDVIFDYFALLQLKVGVPHSRNTIRDNRERQLREALENRNRRKDDLINGLPGKKSLFRNQNIISCVKKSALVLLLIVVCVVLGKTGSAHYVTMFVAAVAAMAIIVIVLLWSKLGIKVWRYRKQLQGEIDEVAMDIERLKRDFLETQIKFYTAGIVIDEIRMMKLDLEQRYQSLVSYNNNLAQWYKEDKQKQRQLESADDQMFINLINPKLLDAYFERNRNVICENINLAGQFRSFDLIDTSLQDLRDELQRVTQGVLCEMLSDFSMCDFILQGKSYAYLGPPRNRELFGTLSRLAQLATRHNENSLWNTSRCLIMRHSPNDNSRLLGVYSPYFDMAPLLFNTDDMDTLTIIVSMSITINNLVH